MPTDAPIKLDFYENGFHQRVAHFMKNSVHLTVAPHMVGSDGKNMEWEVFFWGDKDGEPDTTRALESIVLNGGPDDLEEIADTYARRLDAGVKSKEMFRDVVEGNIRAMQRISDEMKQSERKQ